MSKELACPTEHSEQKWLFQWAGLHKKRYPQLELMFAVPNGGKRDIVTATIMKEEGVRSGVPDIMLPAPIGVYCGLFIEMKRRHGGRLSESQRAWLSKLNNAGYATVVCAGSDEAQNAIIDYLHGREGWKAYAAEKF